MSEKQQLLKKITELEKELKNAKKNNDVNTKSNKNENTFNPSIAFDRK
jgi:diadenosine tetraphosphate (Ap4A) HIT family hydrolase